MLTRRTFLSSVAAASAVAAKPPVLSIPQLTLATASLAGFTLENCFKEIARLKFGGVEIFADLGRRHSLGELPGAIVDRLTPSEKKTLRRLAGKFRFVTTHLPFHEMRPVDTNPAVREPSIAAIERGIRDSGWWGASVGVLHVAREELADYRPVWTNLIETYRRFGDLAAKHKLRLGIETGWPETVDDYLTLIKEIDHDHVGGTVDTGHTRTYRRDIQLADTQLNSDKGRKRYNDVLMRKVEGLGPKLFHFHVDDVRATDWREHRTLGRGIVDWQRLLRHLENVGYRGSFAMELEESPVVEMAVESRAFFAKQLAALAGK